MTFEWPFILWALVALPLLVWAYLRLQWRRPRGVVLVPDVEMLARAAGGRGRWRRWVPPALYLLGIGMVLIGLARPAAPLPVPAREGVVVLSIDVSRSMLADDFKPNRMAGAKLAAHEFVQSLPGGFRVGLVTFSSYATTVVPPTTDRARIHDAIDLLTPEYATAIGEGLLEAVWDLPGRVRPLAGAGAGALPAPLAPPGRLPTGVVVLLSDGQSNRGTHPLEAARIARDLQVKVYTVGVGTPEGTTLTVSGRSILVRLDEETLRGMAETAGGAYHRTTNVGELRRVYRHLGRQIGWERRPTEVTALAAGTALACLIAAVVSSRLLVHRVL
ncbi:MAG: VWA domain-containing protein [bacterium]|nr:VWA domain-containing protein [bacterium]